MAKITINTDGNVNTENELYEVLEKALGALHNPDEGKTLQDRYLLHLKEEADYFAKRIFDSILDDIEKYMEDNWSGVNDKSK